MMTTRTAMAFLAIFLCSATAHAVVTFDWAVIGNPGNSPDRNHYGSGAFGAVAYTYRISKYEVTNAQYVEFLNAVDPLGTNPFGVFNGGMESEPRGGIAFYPAAASGSKYAAKTQMDNKPVNFISFFDAMRFTNWLENGQPQDGSGAESGVYTIGNGRNESRAPGAKFFIPSEDEWYKAAYHQPAAQGGDVDDYWLYATASNAVPTIATANEVGDISNPGANVANYSAGADWNGQDGNVTTVGSAGPLSASFYGTFDQSGNLREWTEQVFVTTSSGFGGVRGGYWGLYANELSAAVLLGGVQPWDEYHWNGFRVASAAIIPEPSTGLAAAVGLLALVRRRRPRR